MTTVSSNPAARRIRPVSVAVAFGAALAAAALSSPAQAGWHGATWGASAPQVDQVFQVPHQPAPATVRQEYSADVEQVTGAPLITFSYSSGPFAFDGGKMFFRRGKLFSIEMNLVRGQDCSQLAAALRQALGRPHDDSDHFPPNHTFSTRSIEWNDAANSNQVRLFVMKDPNPAFTDECTLSLHPLGMQPVS